MRQTQAKDKLMKVFDEWTHKKEFREKPTERDALNFFSYIESNQPHLLNFSCRGDKWYKVKSWLLESNRIR